MILASTSSYASILMLIGIAVAAAAGILLVAHLVGAHRTGPVKNDVYESGMKPIGDARRRFNIRFYMVAIMFVLFDVEVLFLWPWAKVFYKAAVGGQAIGDMAVGKDFLALAMAIFVGFLLVGFAYEWKKGVFQWD